MFINRRIFSPPLVYLKKIKKQKSNFAIAMEFNIHWET